MLELCELSNSREASTRLSKRCRWRGKVELREGRQLLQRPKLLKTRHAGVFGQDQLAKGRNFRELGDADRPDSTASDVEVAEGGEGLEG